MQGTVVTMSFKDSGNRTQTGTFTIYRRSDLTKDERYALIDQGADLIAHEEWEDEDTAAVEKQAALKAGIAQGESFYVTYTINK